MRPLTVILSLALSIFVWSFDLTQASFTAASANKMNGKCCATSDGGRGDRYRAAMWWASHRHPRTCTAYADSCFHWSGERGYDPQVCQAAKAQCFQTGVYTGPYSGRQFSGMRRS